MKTIEISAKCSDMFSAVLSETGQPSKYYDGYVPDFLGTWGDYVQLKIDLETGQILNWKKPSPKELSIFKDNVE